MTFEKRTPPPPPHARRSVGGGRDLSALASASYWLTVAALMLGVFENASYYQQRLPSPLPDDAPAMQFSESRSLDTLQHLVLGIKARHASTDAYNKETIAYLRDRLFAVQSSADPSLMIEIEVHRSSYAFRYHESPGVATVLAGTTTLIARISRRDNDTSRENALLISGHCDSVPRGPAAFDASQGCANNIEVLRALSQSPSLAWSNAVIFAFVAEEHGVSAHYVITGHAWARTIRGFFNQEGAGSGGRAILYRFGAGSGWLGHMYAAAPHPAGSPLRHAVASLNPQTTDYDVYVQYGHSDADGDKAHPLSGVDTVYFDRRYWYHTGYDTLPIGSGIPVTVGSLQQNGENALSIARTFIERYSAHLAVTSDDSVTYYEMGPFFLLHDLTRARTASMVVIVANAAAALAGLLIALCRGGAVSFLKASARGVACVFGSVIAGTCLSALLAYGMHATNGFVFYGHVGLAFTMYCAWGVAGAVAVHAWFAREGASGTPLGAVPAFWATQAFWAVVLALITAIIPRLFYLGLYFASVPALCSALLVANGDDDGPQRRTLSRGLIGGGKGTPVASSALWEVFTLVVAIAALVVPLLVWVGDFRGLIITGASEFNRTPFGVPAPEVVFACLCAVGAIGALSFPLALAHRYCGWRVPLAAAVSIAVVATLAMHGETPYVPTDAPMRTWTQHECALDKSSCNITVVPITNNVYALSSLVADPDIKLGTWRRKATWGYATQFERPASIPDIAFPSHSFAYDASRGVASLTVVLPRDIAAVQYQFGVENATVKSFSVSVNGGDPSAPFSSDELGLFVQTGYRSGPDAECAVRVDISVDGWAATGAAPSRLRVSGVAKSPLSTADLDSLEAALPEWAMAGLDLFPISVNVDLAFP